jgi:LuxR family transcriptional regulator of csgAB operon
MKNVRAIENSAALTRREVEILALLGIGSSNDEIAEKLYISSNTVKTHLYRVFRKIKVPNRFQAALWAARNL